MSFLRTQAPYFAALVGSGSLIVGLYAFKSPLAASRVYGTSSVTQDVENDNSERSDVPDKPTASTHAADKEWTKTLIYAQAVRNVGFGSAIIALAGLYHFEPSPVAAQAMRRCLGLILCVGSVVPMGDAIVVGNYIAAEGVRQGDRDVARKAALAHAGRSLVWIGVGGVCFWVK